MKTFLTQQTLAIKCVILITTALTCRDQRGHDVYSHTQDTVKMKRELKTSALDLDIHQK